MRGCFDARAPSAHVLTTWGCCCEHDCALCHACRAFAHAFGCACSAHCITLARMHPGVRAQATWRSPCATSRTRCCRPPWTAPPPQRPCCPSSWTPARRPHLPRTQLPWCEDVRSVRSCVLCICKRMCVCACLQGCACARTHARMHARTPRTHRCRFTWVCYMSTRTHLHMRTRTYLPGRA